MRDQMIAAVNELAIPVVDHTPNAPTIVIAFSVEKFVVTQYPDAYNATIVAAVARAIVRLRPAAIHLADVWPRRGEEAVSATVITYADVLMVGVSDVSLQKWLDDADVHHVRRAYRCYVKK